MLTMTLLAIIQASHIGTNPTLRRQHLCISKGKVSKVKTSSFSLKNSGAMKDSMLATRSLMCLWNILEIS